MENHQKFMSRCIELAKNGLGTTYPNPLVGSVIVHDGKIIGEGWHRKSGEPHAEVNAVNSVIDKSLLSQATIYVNLEPCSHFGKTPPCCDLILEHKIPNVVIGTQDPNNIVCGNGIKKLKDNGTNVIVGVLESECNFLNRRFFTFHKQRRPFIILKWAESADGFIAPLSKSQQKPVWISNVYSRQLVHKWRSEEQAILVGTQTAIVDNPQLTLRDWHGNNPIRIVMDRTNRISAENHIFDNQAKTLVISGIDSQNVASEKIDYSGNIAAQICEVLHRNAILSVTIEGGKQTLETFINAGLWDEARIFKSSVIIETGILAPVFKAIASEKLQIGTDELLIFENNDQHHNI